MQVSTELSGNIPIIHVEGQIDINNYVEVHELVLAQIDEGRPNILLDFRRLDFMDSATLGMLLRSLDKAKQRGGLLVLVSNPFVDRVLSVTGLSRLFELFTSEEDALARLLSKAS